MASGKYSVAICDKCGFKYPYKELKFEATGLFVCPTCHDGAFDLVNHPQNYSPDLRDNPSIKNPRPDVFISVSGTWEPDDSSPNPKGP